MSSALMHSTGNRWSGLRAWTTPLSMIVRRLVSLLESGVARGRPLVLIAIAFIAACGSGDGGSTPSPLPTLPPDPDALRIRVRADQPLGAANTALAGVGWNVGDLELISPLSPESVRIDSHLRAVSPGPEELRLDDLLSRVERVRALGAEPLVILYDMPTWLGAPRVADCVPPPLVSECSPNRVAPSDFDVWEQLIEDVVRVLALAPAPALRFEVWNEPDLFVFWHDTREAFLETVLRTHRAVARVAAETGLALEVGGPAVSFFPLAAPGAAAEVAAAYVRAVTEADLPLHFVSGHWYANSPRLGPDGNEGFVTDDLYALVSGVNPRTTPESFADRIRELRSALAPLEARGVPLPKLVIDEWNLSPGGFDLRHDSHVGAAFVAGSLIVMEREGLDRADFYRAAAGSRPGDWGLVDPNGERKPSWWVLRAWQQIEGERLGVEGGTPESGLWFRAVADEDEIHVLIASFVATGGETTSIELEIGESTGRATIRILDSQSSDFETARVLPASDGVYRLRVPAESVHWITVARTSG